ncbi:MAG: ABC transporter substrate-binding protein [Synergistales bacterium]|nr:ABC transporter substrate-binding protein [Synergistales bacterium]
MHKALPQHAKTAATLIATVTCLLALSAAAQAWSPAPRVYDGPQVEDLYLVIYSDPDAQVLAMEQGELDIAGDITRPVDIQRLNQAETVDLSVAEGFHLFMMGWNLRAEPWDRLELRRAAACAIPRMELVRDIFQGYSVPVDSYLPPASPYFTADTKHYPYDPETAKEILKEAGWSWSDGGTLIPPGGSKPLEELELLSPASGMAPTTAELARRLAKHLRAIGLPVKVEPLDFSVMVERLNRHEFDMYLLAWVLTRDPDSLYAFYHSSMDMEGGYNLTGYHDETTDRLLEKLKFAPSPEAAEGTAFRSQKRLAEELPVLPIYSRYSIAAVGSRWQGTVVTDVVTADNQWSLLHMHTPGGTKELHWALGGEPRPLNPLAAGSALSWEVLGHLYGSLLSINPETLGDVPWLATEWDIDVTEETSTLHFTLRKGVQWHDGEPFTAEDVKSTISYLQKERIPRYWDSVRDVKEVTSNGNEVTVTLSTPSYWHLHGIGGLPVMPAHILEDVEDWKSWQPASTEHPEREDLTLLVGTGPFVFAGYKPGEFVHLRRFDGFWGRNQ